MKDKEELEVVILRIGNKYLKAPIRLRITIGRVIEGNIKLKKGDEHN
ncbi:hypothetical protein [Clostridium sp.]|nr:hypothetical protein [Clostridium sp.]MDR3594926.1 hypothetical protein [Clostridium sp.]